MNHPEIPQSEFDKLEAAAKAYEALDQERLVTLRANFHLRPPEPYDKKLSFDNLGADLTSLDAIAATIAADTELSPEEKYVLRAELSERWRLQVISDGSGEAFND
jgi:hypothetical protein